VVRVGSSGGEGLDLSLDRGRVQFGEDILHDRLVLGADASTHLQALFGTDRFSVHPVAMSVTVRV